MKWVSVASEEEATDAAVEACAREAQEGLGGVAPDLTLLFVSPHHAEAYEKIPGLLAVLMNPGFLLGCSGGGIIGGGREIEERPALSMVCASLPGVTIHPVHFSPAADPSGVEAETAEGLLSEGLGPEGISESIPGAEPQFLLLGDPFSFPAETFLRLLDDAFPTSVKIGGLASGGSEPGGNVLYLGDEIHRAGGVGVAMTGNIAIDPIVAQGCRPVGNPLFVTRAKENFIFELDNRPPRDILQELYDGLAEEDRDLFRSSLFLGLVMDETKEEFRHGDFLIRNLLGMDRDSGALAVGATLAERSVVQFHLRDAKTSHADLAGHLAHHALETKKEKPVGALLFSCLGRGGHLYGLPNHDTDLFQERFGKIPIGGFFANGEIGPVRGTTFVHGYTSCFALFRPREG